MKKYSIFNPPETISEAQTALGEIGAEIKSVEAAIEDTDPASFGSDQSYHGWYHRIKDKRKYLYEEYDYLESWVHEILDEHMASVLKEKMDQSKRALEAEVTEALKAFDYERKFSDTHYPRHPVSAQARQSKLIKLQVDLRARCNEIKLRSAMEGFKRIETELIVQPFTTIREEVQSELQFLALYFKIYKFEKKTLDPESARKFREHVEKKTLEINEPGESDFEKVELFILALIKYHENLMCLYTKLRDEDSLDYGLTPDQARQLAKFITNKITKAESERGRMRRTYPEFFTKPLV